MGSDGGFIIPEEFVDDLDKSLTEMSERERVRREWWTSWRGSVADWVYYSRLPFKDRIYDLILRLLKYPWESTR